MKNTHLISINFSAIGLMPVHHALCNNMSVQGPRSLCLFTGILGRDAEHIGVNSISFQSISFLYMYTMGWN